MRSGLHRHDAGLLEILHPCHIRVITKETAGCGHENKAIIHSEGT